MADRPSSPPAWPPRAPGAPRPRRPAPQRHARWIDRDNREAEPREESPQRLLWVLALLLVFAVISVMVRMVLTL